MKSGTIDHPKTELFSILLEVPMAQAVGHLEALWHFTAKFAPAGDIGKWPNTIIARRALWTGDPDKFVRALVEAKGPGNRAGWIEENGTHRLIIHDWAQHADKGVHRALARDTAVFADGTWPDLRTLDSRERDEAKRRFTDRFGEPDPGGPGGAPTDDRGSSPRDDAGEPHTSPRGAPADNPGSSPRLPGGCLSQSPARAQPEPAPSQRLAQPAPSPAAPGEPPPAPSAPAPADRSPPLRLAGSDSAPPGNLAGGLAGPSPEQVLKAIGLRDPAKAALVNAGVTAARIREVYAEVMRDETVRKKHPVMAHRLAEELGVTLPKSAGRSNLAPHLDAAAAKLAQPPPRTEAAKIAAHKFDQHRANMGVRT